MASNTTPYTTYRTDRIQLIGNPEQRSTPYAVPGGGDQQFINCYPTTIESPLNGSKRFCLEQRAGLVASSTLTAGVGRGIYYYDGQVFSVIGNKLYKNSSLIQNLTTSTGSVGFVEYAGTNNYLIVLDGTSGWCVAKTTYVVTQIVDVDFPSPHNVKGAYLDGYLFVSKSGTDDIYNSILNDPLTWTTGDFISAEMYPDSVVALVRQNNYIVAIGTQSMEYFYNSGVFPGTPLARNAAAAHTIGTPAADTVVATEEQIIFIGQTGVGGKTIWVMDGFQPTEIGIDPVKKSLNAVGSYISGSKAFCIRSGGHRLFVVQLGTVANNGVTWVYDFDTKMWHQWAGYTGDSSTLPFRCTYACDSAESQPSMLDKSNGFVYTFQYGVPRDYNSLSTWDEVISIAITSKLDYGNMNKKFMSRFSLIADTPDISVPVPVCRLYWSDNDYQTWSTPVDLDLTSTMPTATQLGSFRRRAFKLSYHCLNPIRLEGFEADINMGTQ